MSRRVVVTGLGLASPIGHDLDTVSQALRNDASGIATQPQWAKIDQLETRLAGVVDLDFDKRWPRKRIRTMGRVSLLSVFATDQAVAQAGLDDDFLRSGNVGVAYGSTHGSSSELEPFVRSIFTQDSLRGLGSTAYLKFMSHTTAANLALFYGIRGRVVSTCAACVSASQGIGAGYELVKAGVHDVMLAGGAEALHALHAGVFDIMYATSTKYNDSPSDSPRPFDVDRDGLVVAEGAGTLVLESYDRAKARGAPILAEILGYGTNCDGTHVTSPSSEGMAGAMKLALEDAGLSADRIDYVNAHATATEIGDIRESYAAFEVVGSGTPISSTKGFTGHTLGACGAIETIFCMAMMRDGFLAPNRNLEAVDPECAALDFVIGDPRDAAPSVCMNNNFAFGGINTSLIIGKVA